jgi:hypothetical protein
VGGDAQGASANPRAEYSSRSMMKESDAGNCGRNSLPTSEWPSHAPGRPQLTAALHAAQKWQPPVPNALVARCALSVTKEIDPYCDEIFDFLPYLHSRLPPSASPLPKTETQRDP